MKKEDNNKLERLLQMHEQAEQLSDDDIQKLMDDADNDDDFNTLSAIKRAMARKQASLSDDEIEHQWERFNQQSTTKTQHSTFPFRRSWMQIAAMLVGIVMIAGVAFAAIKVIVERQHEASSRTETTLTADDKTPTASASKVEASDSLTTATTDSANIVRFDDVELQTILNAVAQHHGLKLQYENEQSKHIKMFFKWNKQADIASVVEILNSYDRISIEFNGNILIVK